MSMISLVGNLAQDQARLRQSMEGQSRQLATGYRGDSYGDLGVQARRAIDLKGEIIRRDAFAAAAEVTLGRTRAVQTVMERLGTIASDLEVAALRARGLGTNGVNVVAGTARAALQEAASLLNTRHGNEYLFGGTDPLTPPVPDDATITTGPMATAITAAVAGLGPGNAAAVLAATATAATDPATRPFSAHLEGPALTEPRRSSHVADGLRVVWGVLPSQNRDGEVAESWGRQLLRGLATLAAMDETTAVQDPGYDELLHGVMQMLGNAAREIGAERGAIGAAERHAQATVALHRELTIAMTGQVKAIEEVDIAEVSTRLNETKLRLEASYEVTSSVSRLSLAAFLR